VRPRAYRAALLSTLALALFVALPAGVGAQAGSAATFGKTTVGAASDTFLSGRKRVNRYALPSAGAVSKLSVYLAPTATAGEQAIEGVIYADSAGKPQALIAVSQQLTFKSPTPPAGMTCPSPPPSSCPPATTGSA
jgi:hypothetical protein